MFKVCKICDKKFNSIKMCKRHLEKRICLKRIEKKWQKIKKNMKICEKCGLVLSNQHSLYKHLTKQVPCIKKKLNLSLIELQKDFLEKDKIKRKKFILKKEILYDKIGIDSKKNDTFVTLTEKPYICINENNEFLEDYSKEELLIMLKEKINTIIKISKWVDIAWDLLKELSPENIKLDDVADIVSNEEISKDINNDTELSSFVKEKINNDININLTLNDIIPKILIKEKKEWDNIVKDDDINPLFNELTGYWNTDNFIINPVRHYSDSYNRSLLIRNMKSAKMLSSIICPYFYPNYKSSLDTRAYIDVNKKNSMWLLDDNDNWISLNINIGVKNMIFHSVSAFVDIIRRENELLPIDFISSWENEKQSLENYNSENYKFVVQNIIKRLPTLSIHPDDEEKKLIAEYLNNDEYVIDTLTDICNEYPKYSNLPINIQNSLKCKKIIHSIRFKNKIKRAKIYHSEVNNYYNNI